MDYETKDRLLASAITTMCQLSQLNLRHVSLLLTRLAEDYDQAATAVERQSVLVSELPE